MVYRPTARVLAVLELLQSRGTITGAELADCLEVEPRSVRRYIMTLQDMGIPVEAEPGRYGGYTLRPGFKLPPLMFTENEALVLAIGLRMARQSGLDEAIAASESALAKVERVLPLELRERLSAVIESADVDVPELDEPVQVKGSVLTAISQAIQQTRQLVLVYNGSDGKTERVFDPYGMASYEGRWYTVGFCHLRKAQRVFRLDRVETVLMLNTKFIPPMNFDALDTIIASFQAIPDVWNIDVLLDMPLDEARRRVPRSLATLVQEGQRVRLRATHNDLDDMARLLISLRCPVTILAPDDLRVTFRRIAHELIQIAES